MGNVYRKWLEIDKEALKHNISYIKSKININTKIMAVVKADAYGCGSVECSKLFLEQGAEYLAVSSLGEATILRNNNINAPILIFGFVNEENIIEAINKDLILTVYNLDMANKINKYAKQSNIKAKIHIEINTGMNRLGFYYGKSEEKNISTMKDIIEISKLENIYIDGIYSHFAMEDKEECRIQYNYFIDLINKLESNNINIGLKHICNSWATINCHEFQLDMVRPGISLYGYGNDYLKPSMTFKTIVIDTYEIEEGEGISYNKTYISDKKQRIAILPVGYADGLPRILSNNSSFTINNKQYKQVGNICMDLCTVLIDDNVKIGDTVYLFGNNSNNKVEEIAKKADTIVYEIICRMGKRIPRIYTDK